MWLCSYRYCLDRAARRIDRVDDLVETSREPKGLSVSTDVSHIGAPAARDRPCLLDLARAEVDDRNASGSFRFGVAHMRAAVGDIKLLAIAARIQTVRAAPSRNESCLFECLRVDEVHAVGLHIGNEEKLSIR